MPLILGVIFSFYTSFDLEMSGLIISLLVLSVLIVFNFTTKFISSRVDVVLGVLISVLFFWVGVLNVEYNNSLNRDDYFYKENSNYYQVRVNEPPEIKMRSVKLVVDFISRNDTIVSGKALIYVKKDEKSVELDYGDVLLIKGKFDKTKSNGNPFEFNYSKYLKLFDIHHQAYLNSGSWLKINNRSNGLFRVTYEISSYLSHVIDNSRLNTDNKAIAKALLIGEKEDLSKEVLRTYSSAGAMHVLAVSGLHVGIIMMILMFVFSPIKRIKNGKSIFLLIVLFGVWFYAFVTGLSPSVLRSSLMFSFIVIGKELERDTSVYQSILVSALILIVIDPLVLFKVGFQLSYLAVLGVVYIQPRIYRLFYIKYKAIDYLWQISSVSIAAQLATFPLGLYYFHQFPNLFLISNLIVIPLAVIILVLGISYLVLYQIPYLNEIVLFVLDAVLSLMNFTVSWVKSLPHSISWGISILWYEVVLIYIALVLLVFAFTLKKSRLVFTSMCLFSVLFLMLTLRSNQIKESNEFVVYNIKDELAIDVFYGDKNLFISSSNLINDENKLLFNIKHYWFYKTGRESPVAWQNISKLKESVLRLKSKTISICCEDSPFLFTDFVVVSDVERIPKYILEKWKIKGTKLIIHPSVKYGVNKYLTNQFPKELIYSIKNEGAFSFYF